MASSTTASRKRHKPRLLLVTPALADANNGNWQTARRWAGMLSKDYEVRVVSKARREDFVSTDLLLALHARRSAASIAAFAVAHPERPLVVALTGTDLYGDIPRRQPQALRSLELATALIVLQQVAPEAVPVEHRSKTIVCFQSTPARRTLEKTGQRLRAVVIGHLRAVKDPRTVMRAAQRLAHRGDIVVDHIGSALEADLGTSARDLAAAQPGYRWLGALEHPRALARIQRAHVLVHPSVAEGGAHVVMEALRCGTPVLASRIPGNVGMLGEAYGGYFEVGDDAALAAMLERARDEPAWLAALARQAAQRAKLFAPELEARCLQHAMRRAFRDAAAKASGW